MTDAKPLNPKRGKVVYVRKVAAHELPDDLPEGAGALPIYAIHGINGERLALVNNRDLAFAVARRNDLAPVSVH